MKNNWIEKKTLTAEEADSYVALALSSMVDITELEIERFVMDEKKTYLLRDKRENAENTCIFLTPRKYRNLVRQGLSLAGYDVVSMNMGLGEEESYLISFNLISNEITRTRRK